MRSFFNAWLILIFFVVVMAAASSTNKTPRSNNAEKAINSLEKTLGRKLDKLITVVNASSRGKPNVGPGSTFASCKEIYNNHKAQGNRAYPLQMHYGKVPVYCHMTSHGLGACGGGGWTLVLKTDGSKPTFHFDSKLWGNKIDFNLPGGKTLFDNHETKLPTYWNTPFSKICLGMRIGQQINFVAINKHANSLYSLIADGKYRSTKLGRKTWKTILGSQASLQASCNMEGFNAVCGGPRARIGILGNDEHDCLGCDSRIGFGFGGVYGGTCGNEAWKGGDNGVKEIEAIGYILVQ